MWPTMEPCGIPFILKLFVVLFAIDVSALKDVTVIIPQAVRAKDTVTLQCNYDLEGEELYALKWYKGTKEFFRYIPKELPNTLVFPQAGINVDLSKSDNKQVVLRHVHPDVTGRYKCEVSSEFPNFDTIAKMGVMYVVDVPEEDPTMFIESDFPEVGSTIRGNCTSPLSYPPANVTWLLNGNKVNEAFLKRITDNNSVSSTQNKKQPLITFAGLELDIDSNIFVNGKARIECVVSIFNLYHRVVEKVLEEERPRPRPASVRGTGDAASNYKVSREHLLVAFIAGILLIFLSPR